MFPYLITALIDYVFCILAAARKDSKASVATALVAFCLGTWSLELFLLSYIDDVDVLSPLFHLTRWGMFFIPFSFSLFTYQLLAKKSALYKNLVLVPGFISCSALSWVNLQFLPSKLMPTEGGFLPEPDITFYWFVVNFSWLTFGGIVYVVMNFKKVAKRDRQRIVWLLSTLCFLLFFGWTASALFVEEFYLSKFYGAIINLIFASLFFYTSSDSQLVNLKLAFSEGFAKILVLSAYVVFYFVFLYFLDSVDFSIGGILFILLYVLIITQTYPKVSQWVLPRVKSIFSGTSYDHEDVRLNIHNLLYKCVSLNEVVKALGHLFYDTVRIENYCIFFSDAKDAAWLSKLHKYEKHNNVQVISARSPLFSLAGKNIGLVMRDEASSELETAMRDVKAECLIPVMHKGEVLAIITVGPPLNNDYYVYEDMYLFNWLGKELGLVIDRIIKSHHAIDELGEARKMLSLIGVMNQYNHDIKTPLAIIDGVLSTDIYSPEKQREIVMEQVERGTKLIATMATILRGHRSRSVAPVILNNILLDSLFVFDKKFHKVDIDCGELPVVVGDAVDLKIMFVNAIKNAAEAGDANRALELSIKSWSECNDVIISIADTGVGLAKRQCENLWGENISNKRNGSGIGLQAMKRIADEHGASILVKSTLGQGTTFIFRFASADSEWAP